MNMGGWWKLLEDIGGTGVKECVVDCSLELDGAVVGVVAEVVNGIVVREC